MIKASPAPLDHVTDKVQNPRARMVFGQNDRMAGSVAVFERNGSFAAEIADLGKINTAAIPANALAEDNSGKNSAGGPEENFGFFDFLDIINPLQHIPLVSTLYQHMTGDTIKPAANIMGAALFGGPLGAAGSIAVTVASEVMSGKEDVARSVNVTENAAVAFADLRQGSTPYNS